MGYCMEAFIREAFMAVHSYTGSNFEVKEAADGSWLALCNGIQWGNAPHDASGCSSQTFRSEEDAWACIREQIAF
jgi:hypothetical protein